MISFSSEPQAIPGNFASGTWSDNMPSNVRWAIAGRNRSKLEEVAAEMKVTEAGGKWIALVSNAVENK